MNEEEQLGGTLPELTEEERQQLLADQERSQSQLDELGQAIAVDEEPEAEATAPVEQPQQQTEQTPEVNNNGSGQADTNPLKNPDGSINYEALDAEAAAVDQISAESLLAIPTGVVDAVVDAANFLVDPEDAMRNAPGLPKIPKFENDVTQTVRELSSIVVPTLALGGGGSAALASKTKNVKLLADPLVKYAGNTLFQAGVGAGVDYVTEFNQKDHNATGMLKKTFPRWWGWVPDSIATLDSDSPDVKRAKNVTEGTVLGVGTDMVLGLTKWARQLWGMDRATRFVAEGEKATNFFKKNVEIDLTPEEVVERSAGKRTVELDEIGAYNFDRSTDLDRPIFGYHDLYGHQEQGIRSVDDLGIIGATVDVVRINKNIDSTYGRVGSMLSEGALKFMTESIENSQFALRGLAETIKDAGEYGYQTASGRYISHGEIMEEGTKLASDFHEMDLAELQRTIYPGSIYQGKNVDTRTPELTSEAYAGVMGAIKLYMDDFVNMDIMKAQAYVGTSLGGQISDMSQGVRLIDETAALNRAQEMVLERVEFLMAQKGMTSYARGRALNMLNLWDRMTAKGSKAFNKAESTRITNLIKNEKNPTLQAMERIRQESADTVANLKRINEENPQMLAPLMMAYELTDGNVKTIHGLNQYVRKSTGVISKAFIDLEPEIPSVIIQGFYANLYNSTLSALSTPIKAIASGVHLMVEKPLRTFAGALPIINGSRSGDFATIRRGLYQYNNTLDALQKSFEYMGQIFQRSALDPNVINVRDDLGLKNTKQLEVLNAFADGKAREGDFGPQALMQNINDMNDLANHPWLRFGTRSMQAMDGFTQSMVAHIETRGRVFDEITEGGTKQFDKAGADELADKAYKAVFDEDGIIRDTAVEKTAGEISMNLDNKFTNATSDLIRMVPALKPFLLFTKTPLNELALTASYNPLGLFVKDLNAYKLPFDQMPGEEVDRLLRLRGVEPTEFTARAKYNEIRADLKGRKALGNLMVGGGVGLFMTDRLHGNGHYNRQKQKLRREAQWKPRSIKGLDGKWYSYDGLGPLTNWLAFTADVMDNFDSLSPDEAGENLKKASFILASSITEKSMLAGLQPFLDVVRGDGGAINKWGSSFLSSATIRGSSQLNEIARLMDPALKEVDTSLTDLIMNRIPLLKSSLPKEYDWIDGGEVNLPDNFLARLRNAYTPWKESGEISPEKQFLIDIEYDATPTLRTDGKGTELTNTERSEITNEMGKEKYFRDAIRRVMKSTSANAFRSSFKTARRKELKPDISTIENLHVELDLALRESMALAMANTPSMTSIQRKSYVQGVVGEYLRRGGTENIERAERFMDSMEKNHSR